MNEYQADSESLNVPESFQQRLRSLFAKTEQTVEREKEIAQKYRSDLRGIESRLEQAIEVIEVSSEPKLAEIISKHETELAEALAEIEKDYEMRKDVFESERDRVLDESETVEQSAREELDQAVFLIDSVYEGEKEKLNKRLEKLRLEVQGHGQMMADMKNDAKRFLVTMGADVPPEPEEITDDRPSLPDPAKEYMKRKAEVDTLFAEINKQGMSKTKKHTFYAIATLLGVICLLLTAAKLMEIPMISSWIPSAIAAGIFIVMILIILVNGANARSVLKKAYPLLCTAVEKTQRSGQWWVDVESKRMKAALTPHYEKRNEDIEKAKKKYAPLIKHAMMQTQARVHKMEGGHDQHINTFEAKKQKLIATHEQAKQNELKTITEELDHEKQKLIDASESEKAQVEIAIGQMWTELKNEWTHEVAISRQMFDKEQAYATSLYPDYDSPAWDQWESSKQLPHAIPVGHVTVDLHQLTSGVPTSEQLQLDDSLVFEVPVMMTFPDESSLLIRTGRTGRDVANGLLQSAMLKLLAGMPAGQAHFTLIDPVDLGQNFAGFMHLADYENSVVGKRIWTEPTHIDQQLVDLTEHMENVIQKYLRNEYETIDAYNQKAGELAEPYRFVVIADFPVNVSEESMKRLKSIVSSGPRCGVYTLIALDARQKLPSGFEQEDFVGKGVFIVQREDHYVLNLPEIDQFPLTLTGPPPEQFLSKFLSKVGAAAESSHKIEVPFNTIAPIDDQLWTRSSQDDLKIPVGRAGATRVQHMTFGKGIAQHALLAGKTGSGKSSLLHVMVTNLSLWFSPDEVQFYLIDFKKGVEFKAYAIKDLAHAQAIAIESDREFGLSILQKLDAEMHRRGDLFRDLAVQDITGFRKTNSTEKLPRILLIIDEFQEFFSEDDKTAQEATLLLDRLVRQGRAFGMHVILGTQTLAGAYGLARSTIEQMAVRVALQCSDADSELILGDNNHAARLLSRPGEAIYNDAGGLLESNAPFQVAWLSDEVRDTELDRVNVKLHNANYKRTSPLIVFEGNAPASFAGNRYAQDLIATGLPTESSKAPLGYLGEPIAIKPPTSIVMRKQAGTNMLIVGQRDEPALAMIISTALSLSMQHAKGKAKFIVLDGSMEDSPVHGLLAQLKNVLPHDVQVVEYRQTDTILSQLADELEQRQATDKSEVTIYILLYGMQRYRSLRKQEDDFSFSFSDDNTGETPATKPDKCFASLLKEGPGYGIHTLAWCDSAATLNRTIERAMMREFDQRILFQMSANDSSQLIDTPEASKLGLHRAIYFSEENGILEKFRPFALLSMNEISTLLNKP